MVTLPGQVLGAEVVVATETSVTISWPAVADGGAAVQYGYRLQTGGNKSNGDATTLTLTGTYADGDRFRITLWATNADGESRAQDYDFTLEIEGPTPPPEGEGTP